MDLGSVFSRVVNRPKAKDLDEQFLAVKISSNEVLATLWSIESGQVDIGHVGIGKIEGGEFTQLLHACDTAISLALGDKEMPAAKTIFGVSPDWIEEGKIVPTKLETLRKLCKELDLRPLGYVQLFEAIENYFKEIEGAPLTAILVGLDGQNGWVTLYRAGKNLGTVALSEGDDSGESITQRIEQALHHFTQLEILPARIIIYDGRKDLQSLEEKIMAHPWTKQLQFLHFPRVEALVGEALVKAVAIAGGTQMGAKLDIGDLVEVSEAKTGLMNEESGEVAEKEIDQAPINQPEVEEVSAEEAGFVQDGNLGRLSEMKTFSSEPMPTPTLAPKKLDLTGFLGSISLALKKISLPSFKVSSPSSLSGIDKRSKKTLIIAGLAIIIVLVLVGIGLYSFPKANVTVFLISKPFDRQMDATVSGQFATVSEIGSKKGVATGKKMVGDKAHGVVTIYGASDGRTFASGTVISSTDGLKFSLDQEVSVASASDFLTPATVNAKITAVDIGEKYNLGANARFSINGVPSTSYLAKNESAISGGTSHEATVVVKADQDRLQATLAAELSQKAQGDLQSQLSPGQSLLPNAITSEISKKKFSKDIDAEADTFTLDLTMDFKGITVSQDELVGRFMDKFSEDIPQDYQFNNSSASLDIKSAKMDKSGNAILSVELTGTMLPKLDTQEIITGISGKNAKQAAEIIVAKTGVDRVEIAASPKILQGLIDKFLPWKKENIKVETVSN